MEHISIEQLRDMTEGEGLVLQGCGGNLQEWVSGINELLTEEGILLDGDTFDDIYVFEYNDLTNILFSMEGIRLDVGRLAMWRLETHNAFGGTWLSDYLVNQLGITFEEIRGADRDGTVPAQHDPSAPAAETTQGDRPEADDSNDTSPLAAHIENATRPDLGGFVIPLPTTKDTLRPLLEAIEADADDPKSIDIQDVRSSVDNLADVLHGKDVTLCELNYLAVKISNLDSFGIDAFCAALEARWHTENITEIINLTENLDRLDLQPAFSEEHYGEHLLDVGSESGTEILERLNQSENANERYFARHVTRLEALVDELSYGRAVVKEEGGVFTDFGYLTASGEVQALYRRAADIPQEYRLFLPEFPLQITADVDLLPFLLKVHAIGGDYSRDAAYNLKTLVALRSDEYLLLLDGRSAHLAETAHAYQRGSTEFCIWANTPCDKDTVAFSIHITESGNGHLVGDITKIDAAKCQKDILAHSVYPHQINATSKNGEMTTYTPAEWDALTLQKKDHIQNWQREFDDDAYIQVRQHIKDVRTGREAFLCATGENDIIAQLSAAYRERVQNPREDFLCLSQSAAQQILASGDADVYRLLPDGPEKLSPVEAVKSGLWLSEYREFAMRCDELPKLERWAKRSTDAVLSAPEHGEHKKSHEEEL
jgi:hypothetical protein